MNNKIFLSKQINDNENEINIDFIVHDNLLITSSSGFKIEIYEIENNFKLIKTINENYLYFRKLLAFKNMLITFLSNKLVNYYDINKNFSLIKTFKVNYEIKLLISYKNNLILSCINNSIKIIDIYSFKLLEEIWDFNNNDELINLSTFKNMLIAISYDKQLKIYDISDNFILLKDIKNHNYNVNSFTIYKNYIIIESNKKDIYFLDIENDLKINKIIKNDDSIFFIFHHLDYLIVGLEYKIINIYDLLENYKHIKKFNNNEINISKIKAHKKLLIFGSIFNNKIWIFDLNKINDKEENNLYQISNDNNNNIEKETWTSKINTLEKLNLQLENDYDNFLKDLKEKYEKKINKLKSKEKDLKINFEKKIDDLKKEKNELDNEYKNLKYENDKLNTIENYDNNLKNLENCIDDIYN